MKSRELGSVDDRSKARRDRSVFLHHPEKPQQPACRVSGATGVPRAYNNAAPPRTTIGPQAQAYCRVLGATRAQEASGEEARVLF